MSEEKLQQLEARCLGLKVELQGRLEDKDVQAHTKSQLNNHMRKIETVTTKVKHISKEHHGKTFDKSRKLGIQVAINVRQKKGSLLKTEYWRKVNEGKGRMFQDDFLKFIDDLGVVGTNRHFVELFQDSIKHSGSQFTGDEKPYLNESTFFMTVANAYYSACKKIPLNKEAETTSDIITHLEEGAVVNAIEGPVHVNGTSRMKVVQTKPDGTFIQGWATLRVLGVDHLRRYSPYFIVVAETVLTDVIDLKDFQSVRRLKEDELFLATNIPTFREESQTLRIEGMTEQQERGYVTIRGNKGTIHLKNQPITFIFPDFELSPEQFSKQKFERIWDEMTKEQYTGIRKTTDDLVQRGNDIVTRMTELDSKLREGTDYVYSDFIKLCQEVDNSVTERKTHVVKLQGHISHTIKSIQNIDSLPYIKFRTDVQGLSSSINETNAAVHQAMQKKVQALNLAAQRESARSMAKERTEMMESCKILQAELTPKIQRLDTLFRLVKEFGKERELPNMSQPMLTFVECLRKLKEDIQSFIEECENLQKWVSDNLPKPSTPIPGILVLAKEMDSTRMHAAELLEKLNKWKGSTSSFELIFKEKCRVDFTLAFRDFVRKEKNITVEDAFSKVSNGKNSISAMEFEKFCLSICPGFHNPKEFLNTHLGFFDDKVTVEHFRMLSKAEYRCIKRALATDVVDISEAKRIRRIELEETVEVLEKYQPCPKTGITRFRGKMCEGAEAFFSITGNKHSRYLILNTNGYLVTKETVMTDQFQMKGFRSLKRLKPGDYIRGWSEPEFEAESNLWRMRATSFDGKVSGWVSVRTNQGPVFITHADLPENCSTST